MFAKEGFMLIVIGVVCACSSSSQHPAGGVSQGDSVNLQDGGACSIPVSANTYEDGSTYGCAPGSSNECSSGQYADVCHISSSGQITPPTTLGCQISGAPQAAGVQVYCCPCQ
jgi:hypothetical protein